MATTAGALSVVERGVTTLKLASGPATDGTAPYSYQWHRSTTSGFTPGGGNAISGATALTLDDTGLIPGTQYYYKVVATDSTGSPVSDTSDELAVATLQDSPAPNQFSQNGTIGQTDLRFNGNTVAVQIDASETGELSAGQAVKMVDSAGGVPKVIACDANGDQVLGFLNYSIKDRVFKAGDAAEISMKGNVMFLRATGAIARGTQVVLDVTTIGGVAQASGSGNERIVGWAYDKASAGDLIRVWIETPSFAIDA